MNFQLQCRRKSQQKVKKPCKDDDARANGVSSQLKDVERVFVRSLVAASTCRPCAASSGPRESVINRRPSSGRRSQRVTRHACKERGFATSSRQNQALAVATPELDEPDRGEYLRLIDTYEFPGDLWEQPGGPQDYPRMPVAPTRTGMKSEHDPGSNEMRPSDSRRLDDAGSAPVGTERTKTVTTIEHVPLAPRLVLTAEQEDREAKRATYHQRYILPPEDDHHAQQLQILDLLASKSERGTQTTRIYEAYLALPNAPRLRYVQDRTAHKVFQHLAWVEYKDQDARDRYFAFLDDALASEVEVTAAEWNTAISFAGRYASKITSEEVKRAVETWMRMENEGQQPDDVTFNILLDIAARAGRFALANIVVRELHSRGLPLTRYFHTSRIFTAGLRRDGHGVRQAFRELVNAGEIVDTAVMNCVILGLVRSGEAASAESVFDKMKTLHAAKNERATYLDWRQRKALGYELRDKAQQLRAEQDAHVASFFGSLYSNENHKEDAQRKAPIHPDYRTCRILIKYHCEVSGNLERVQEMLKELKSEACGRDGRMRGGIYVSLFTGFWKFGGHAYTAWNRTRLEGYWKDFLRDVEEGGEHRSGLAEPSTQSNAILEPPNDNEAEASAYNPFHANQNPPEPPNLPATLSILDPLDPKSFHADPEPSFESRPAHFSPRLITVALRAFYKCAGIKRMVVVWKDVQTRWPEMEQWERERVRRTVERLGREDWG